MEKRGQTGLCGGWNPGLGTQERHVYEGESFGSVSIQSSSLFSDMAFIMDWAKEKAAGYLRTGIQAGGTLAGNAVGGVGSMIENAGKSAGGSTFPFKKSIGCLKECSEH